MINSNYFDGNGKHGATLKGHTTMPRDNEGHATDWQRCKTSGWGGHSWTRSGTPSLRDPSNSLDFKNERCTGQRQARKMQRKKNTLYHNIKHIIRSTSPFLF